MDLAENRFGKTWKHFLEALKVDYNCSLADVCRDQHTTFGGSSSNLVVISFLFQLSSSFLILLKVVDMFAF